MPGSVLGFRDSATQAPFPQLFTVYLGKQATDISQEVSIIMKAWGVIGLSRSAWDIGKASWRR